MWNFTVSLAGDGTEVAEAHSGARQAIPVGFPLEFGGRHDIWCPEGLLAASVGGCLMTSFRYYLRRHGGEAHAYMSAIEATLAKTREGLRITGIDVATVISVEGEANIASARRATSEAQRTCPISHSLACPVHVKWEVNDLSVSPNTKEKDNADL